MPGLPQPSDKAARLIAGGASLVASSVLADAGIEHYRGSFENRAMVLPLAGSALSILTDTRLALGARASGGTGALAMSVHAANVAIGAAGLGFHVYNILKQPGGFTFGNVFYHAPIAAPAALMVAGTLGATALALGKGASRLGPVPLASGRSLAGFAAFALAGTSAEAAVFHFRGAYHNPFMWVPVVVPPIAALALGKAAVTGTVGRITNPALTATAVLGFAGAAFHAYGVSRNMGGWRNWRQNLIVGPPIPAPPSFTGIAIAGLGALLLMRRFARG
ncbi:hypothetical protein [Altericroceibacterium xinjiangense]|uniref:hypothetical protein n=1 Tax=Altericroceibacterium xinjiangense TaxID=762261 RepID=UPI000F7D9897|nr:hypothetical protein [Altericroceibacterium xinjiangense]